MIEQEKVISTLKKHIKWLEEPPEMVNCLQIAKCMREALKAYMRNQVEQEPAVVYKHGIDGTSHHYYCPTCDDYVGDDQCHSPYCDGCGQLLDWSLLERD